MKFSRLIVLAIALCAGGIAAFLAGRSKPPPQPQVQVQKADTIDVLTAKTDIGIGRALQASDVTWQPWPAKYASPQFIRKPEHSTAAAQVVGMVTRAPLVAGEPIREAKLIKTNGSGYMAAILPAGMRAASTAITPEAGAGGFILPNDRVDVILTSAEKSGANESYKSRTILTDVRVLAIDQIVEGKADQNSAIGKVATLELTPADAEKLSLARRLGTISLTLRSLAEKPDENEKISALDRQDGINIVRFGQSSSQLPPN
jgi:pilus assembly protein CpaB